MPSEESSSVMFSLKELQALEEERVAEEQARKQQAQAVAERERAERIARQQREEQERIAAEQQRRDELARQEREAEARAQALRAAAVERARVEAQQAAQAQQAMVSREHEKVLAEIDRDRSKVRLRRGLIATAVSAFALIGGAAGLYFGKIQPEAERAQAEHAQRLAETEAAIDRARRELSEAQADRKRLIDEIDRVTDEQKKVELQRQLDEANQRLQDAGGTVPTRPKWGPKQTQPAPAKPKNCGDPNDPMNECL